MLAENSTWANDANGSARNAAKIKERNFMDMFNMW